MGRVSKTTQALYNGVSQQAAGLRLDSQVEEMVNMWPDVGKGVSRRKGTTHVSRAPFELNQGWDATASAFKTYTHKIDKSLDERYIVNFTTDAGVTPTTEIRILDLEGAELPVVYANTAASDYIESAPVHGAGGLLRAVSVLDTTFLVNTSVTPAMTAALSQWGESLVNKTYKWTPSGSGTNEYYVNLFTGTDEDTNGDGVPDGVIVFDPILSRPEEVLENSVEIPEGTLSLLAVGEWAYGDADALGYDTLYVRLTDETDPDTKADGFVFMKSTQDFAYIHVSASGGRDYMSLEVDGHAVQRLPTSGQVDAIAEAFKLMLDLDLTATGVQGRFTGAGGTLSNTIRLTMENGGVNEDFNVKISKYGNVHLIKSKVDKFSDLPPQGRDGDILEVTGEAAESTGGSYYVRYDEDTSRWVETLPDGLPYEIDATTMPHKMTRLQDDGAGTVTGTPDQLYFYVQAIDWTDKAVGDSNSNPVPSFIGTPIEDIFFYQDRLGFASGENVIMSQTKEYFNFFAQTTTDTLDDDPIDVTIGQNSAVTIKWVFPFTNSLELIGTTKQFSFHSGTSSPALTPSNVVVDPTTSLEVAPDVRPAEMNNTLFIPVRDSRYMEIFRYQVDPEGVNTRAFSITKHVPKYIEDDPLLLSESRGLFGDLSLAGNRVSHIEANADTQMLFVVNYGNTYYTARNPPFYTFDELSSSGCLYVYSMFEQGDELVQSAWHKWNLPTAACASFGGSLYSFIAREGNPASAETEDAITHLESMVLEPRGHVIPTLEILGPYSLSAYEESPEIYLDDWVEPNSTTILSNAVRPRVDMNIPYHVRPGDVYWSLYFVAFIDTPSVLEYGFNTAASVLVSGTEYEYTCTRSVLPSTAWTDETLGRCGFKYDSHVKFSQPTVGSGDGVQKIGSIIHLRSSVEVAPTDAVTIETNSSNREFKVFDHTSDNDAEATSLEILTVGVHKKAKDSSVYAKSSDLDPLSILSYSWTANYINHSRSL